MRPPQLRTAVLVLLALIVGCAGGGNATPDAPAASDAKELGAFSFLQAKNSGLSMDVTTTITGTAIAATLPAGTDVTALVATFSITGSSVKVGSTPQVSGTTANNFTSPVTYTVVAADASAKTYTVTVAVAASTAKDLTSFAFLDATNTALTADVTATITGTAIRATVPFGTNVNALVAAFTTSGASVKVGSTVQVSGTTANGFASPVMYTVSAADGSTKVYTVTVEFTANPANDLTAFSFLDATNTALTADVTATINGAAITATVPFGTDVSALVATFTTTGAAVMVGATAQVSGTTPNNFTSPVIYTVTAANASTQIYTVTVAFTASNRKDLTAFSFRDASNTALATDITATITGTAISAVVPAGTDVTALVATFTTTGNSVAVGGTTQVSGTTPNNFTNPVTYTVTAADSSTKIYMVTVMFPAPLTCETLPAPANGTVAVSNGGVYPSTATYGCTTGRALSGPATRSCQFPSGTYAGTAPTCEHTFMVVRVGDGVLLDASSAAVVVQERRVTDGAVQRTITLPVAAATGVNPLTLAGSANSEGHLALSANGRYVTLGGYAAAPGTAMIAASTTATVKRVIGRIDAAGAIDTTTLLDTFSGNNIRGATTDDGTRFWTTGGSNGVQLAALGSTGASTTISTTVSNLRSVQVVAGQLYTSTGSTNSGVYAVGTGVSTTGSQVAALLAGTGSVPPHGFAFVDASAVVAGVDRLYIAINSAVTGGANRINIQRWSFNGTTWTIDAAFAPVLTGSNVGALGVSAFAEGTGFRVVATATSSSTGADNQLVTFVDDGTATPAVTSLGSAGASFGFRGVAHSPTAP